MLKYFCLFLCLVSLKTFSHPVDLKYISPEKRYEIEKAVFEEKKRRGLYSPFAEFPDFFLWQQMEIGREKRFYEWLKTFLLYLEGAINCEMSYYIWTEQNPVK